MCLIKDFIKIQIKKMVKNSKKMVKSQYSIRTFELFDINPSSAYHQH